MIDRFRKESSGATAVEYGLLAGVIGIAVMISINALGGSINVAFATLTASIK